MLVILAGSPDVAIKATRPGKCIAALARGGDIGSCRFESCAAPNSKIHSMKKINWTSVFLFVAYTYFITQFLIAFIWKIK